MTDFTFTVPGAPLSINATYKIVQMRSGAGMTRRLAKTPEAVAWQLGIVYIVKTARPSGWIPGRRVRINMAFWMNRAGRDADNPQKALLDSIATALGVNDSTFLPCVVSNEVDKTNPRVEVTIRNEGE
jgi:Holliday junction resolvase RusA-like endonuclease